MFASYNIYLVFLLASTNKVIDQDWLVACDRQTIFAIHKNNAQMWWEQNKYKTGYLPQIDG